MESSTAAASAPPVAVKRFAFKKKGTFANGDPVMPEDVAPVKAPVDATKAVLAIVLNHTAEVFHGVVDAICEHYSLSKEEVMGVVVAHPKFTEVIAHPVLNDMGFLTKEEVSAPLSAPPPPKKPFKIVKKVKAPSGAAEPSA